MGQRPGLVNRPRHQFLAGPALPDHQQIASRRRGRFHPVIKLTHRGLAPTSPWNPHVIGGQPRRLALQRGQPFFGHGAKERKYALTIRMMRTWLSLSKVV